MYLTFNTLSYTLINIRYGVVPGRVHNSSGSGSGFGKSSGSGLIGFAFSSKVRVRVYRVSFLELGFSGLSGLGFEFTKW